MTPLAGSALDWGDKLIAVMLLSGHVRQSILLTQELAAGRAPDEEQADSEHRYGLAMRELVDRDRFPEVAAMFASEMFATASVPTETTAREDFDAGLEIVLDGIAARIARRADGR